MDKLNNVKELNDLEGIGIKLNRQMEKINAKVMNAPSLELGKKNTVDRGR
jgi:hypothetical protein